MKEKMKQRLKINLYLLLGYLPIFAFDAGRILFGAAVSQPVTALHAVYAALVWTALAMLYLKTTPRAQIMDATCTMSMTWTIWELIILPLFWTLAKPPYAMTRGEFSAASAPWMALTLIFTFLAPFLGLELYRALLRGKRPAQKKKVVIIGGGISGLTAAVYAAKAGFETVVFEQHAVAGGECTGWDRQGYHIDNCIHWMMGSNPGTALNDLWRTVGAIDDAGVVRADNMYTSHLGGETLTLWQDIDRAEREMIALSPEDEPAIRELMADCRASMRVTIPAGMPSELMCIRDIAALSKCGGSLKLMKKYKGMDVSDLMARFRHPLIGCAISDFTPACSTASGFPMAYGNYAGGDGGIPVGGSRAMAQRMRATAEGYGAAICTGCGAKRIILENGRATGVELENGGVEACDYVIPACDASVTFSKLLPESYMGKLMRSIFADGEAYPVFSTFQAAFAVDSAENIFPSEQVIACPELVFAEGMGERITVKSYAYEPSFAPAGKQVLQTLQGGPATVYDMWKALYDGDREAYRKKKLEIAEATRAALERNFPELQGKLTLLDAWTPMTYSRYCSAYKGFYQAPQITKRSANLPYPPAAIEGLDNVILAGQWLNLPGGLPGSAIAGKYAVQRVARLAGLSWDM